MQKHALTTSLFLFKTKNEHEVTVLCTKSKKFKDLKKKSGKFKVTQEVFFNSKTGNPVKCKEFGFDQKLLEILQNCGQKSTYEIVQTLFNTSLFNNFSEVYNKNK